jgi:hypothetical protein
MTAYITLKGGKGFMRVLSYDAYTFVNQGIYSGYFRNTGWKSNQAPLYEEITLAGAVAPTLSISPQVPATGNDAVPDEQAHIPPRALTWDETKIRFTLAGRTVAEVYWKYIKGVSNNPPESTV